MSRRRGLFEDLLELAARLPWAASVALAGGLYIGLHLLASTTPVKPQALSELGAVVGHQFIATIARLLQYIVPTAFLLGAAVSFMQRRRAAVLLADATADPAGSIANLSWQAFERLVGASFEREGYAVARTGGGGADGGVDLVLTKGRETTLVKCKQWRAQKVGVTTVRELYGVMAARGAARGVLVSAGRFTPDALAFATGRSIDLIDGQALAARLRGVNIGSATVAGAVAPTCPSCGSRMLQRVSRHGRSAGESFWGCEAFPRCRATLPMN